MTKKERKNKKVEEEEEAEEEEEHKDEDTKIEAEEEEDKNTTNNNNNKKRKRSEEKEEEKAEEEEREEEAGPSDSVRDAKRQDIVFFVDLEDNKYIALSLARRATIKEFKNKLYIDVREYYKTKNGDSKPGKKGVFLTPEHFQTISEAGIQIQNALKDRNTSYELELDAKKFVHISDFRNNYSIDIREFYTKDGNRLPTRKGISLNKEEFEMLLKYSEDLLSEVKVEQKEK
eukprot:TRINITY_DN621_c0_g1_i5.p2 TRINITY_DN621_c0_g1~~TRINITY_DN621_c0_g1_i5.p2  ORF type:complete len:231 (-),score=62.94 TRINITY_DN621_c0_g1_i5:271-963(-)